MIDSMKIERLVAQPESKTLEFKRDLSSLTNVLKTIVAFANTAGGVLIIGRSSDGELYGIEDPFAAEEQLANAVANNIYPSILPEIAIATVEGKNLLVVQVAHWKGPFYLKKEGAPGGVYIRLGSTSRPANPDTLAEMKRQESYSSYDQEPLISLNEGDLDESQIQEVFAKKGKSIDQQKMVSLALLAEDNHRLVPTIGGLILFGKEKQRLRYAPDAQVSCARFRGVDKTHIIDRFEETGTILDAVESVPKFIARNTRLAANITATRRVDIPEYPPLAIREALINALVHADYTIKGLHTRISIFDDRLEIFNSGMLPFGYTMEDFFKGVSRPRNRVVARTFRELDLMEEWGSGYRRIVSECEKGGYPYPVWSESATWMVVTFYPHPETALPEKTRDNQLTSRQERILNIVLERGPLSASEVENQLRESISSRTVSRELAYLRNLGLILSVGQGASTRWTVR